jgi:hypothetical protein
MRAFVFLQAAEKAFPLRPQSFEPLNEGIGSWRKGTYPLACDRSERFKRSLVCTSSGFSLLAALLEGLFEQLVIGGQS